MFQLSLKLSFQITENRMKLKRLEERTINEEITVDEVAALTIEETEEEVDSTTPKKDTTSKISALPSFNRKRIFQTRETACYRIHRRVHQLHIVKRLSQKGSAQRTQEKLFKRFMCMESNG